MRGGLRGLEVVRPVFLLLLIIWIVQIANAFMAYQLNDYFGLYPRKALGIPGIPLSTFLHGSFEQATANSLPILILGLIKSSVLQRRFWISTLLIILIGGGLLWLLGRPNSVHVGASGLVFGYFGFLVTLGMIERSFASILGALAAVALYGGLIWGIFGGSNVSWEGHLLGILAGVLTALIIARRSR